jgi:folate-binding protein YgfZ
LTNDVAALNAGDGCYAAYLTPQGRMMTDLWVYELGDVILLELPRDTKDLVLTKLDQFIFTEDVQLGDVTETFAGVAVIGPAAAAFVAETIGTTLDVVEGLKDPGAGRVSFRDQPAIIVRVSDTGVGGFEVLVAARDIDALTSALRARGAVDADAEAAEALRIEAGVPRFHRDMDEETIPLEAGIESRAISLTKGCYVGQEVIIRVLHRGHGRVARKLVGLSIEGETVPPPAAPVQAEGRDVGRVTSSTWSPVLGRPIALAYVQRDFVEPGTSVSVAGQDAHVAKLPFVASVTL